MSLFAVLLLILVLIAGSTLSYLLGWVLGRLWWLPSVVFGVVLLVAVIFIIIGLNSSTPVCTDLVIICVSTEQFLGFIAFFVAIIAAAFLIVGSPIAYLGARHKFTQKEERSRGLR